MKTHKARNNARESVIFDGHVIYYQSTLANKLETLAEIQTLLHQEELTEMVSNIDDGAFSGLKEVKEDG